MAYDERLAERIRDVMRRRRGLVEKKMFGGLAFMVNGNMFCGVIGDELVLRLGEEGAAGALKRKHTREMDFTGRVLKTMVYVEAGGIRTEAQLKGWIDKALGFVRGLPGK